MVCGAWEDLPFRYAGCGGFVGSGDCGNKKADALQKAEVISWIAVSAEPRENFFPLLDYTTSKGWEKERPGSR
jgi:hypothetical protein